MFTRVRTIKGRRYLYAEWRWREGGKVRSRSKLIRALDAVAGSLRGEPSYGVPSDDSPLWEQSRQNDAKREAEREAALAKLHADYGLKLGSPTPIPQEKTPAAAATGVSVTPSSSAEAGQHSSPADATSLGAGPR